MAESPGPVRLAAGVSVAPGDLVVTAVASGGPGGQHANKTATKVELRLAVTAIAGLSGDASERLRSLAGAHLISGDVLLVTCDETRSQRRNRDLAIDRVRALVVTALVRPKPRKRTRPGRGAIERRLSDKAATAARKRDRGRRED